MAASVIVVDYDPNWPVLFRALQRRIADALGSVAARIEHVGSTAVPNLAAKPILDIDVLLGSASDLPTAIERLANVGYTHQGDLGIAGREAFRAPAGDPAHNLYVCLTPTGKFHRHLLFRDYLRAHPDDAKAYGELKQALALRFRDDRSAYVDGKSEVVTEIIVRTNNG